MEIKRRMIDHSKRWSKVRRQLSEETASTPPPLAATSSSPVEEEESDSEDEDDSGESEDEEELPAPQPTEVPPQEPTQSRTLSRLASATSSVQASASQTGIVKMSMTGITSPTATLDTAVNSASSKPTTASASAAVPLTGVQSESSSSLSTMSIAAISVGSIIGASACLIAVLYFFRMFCCRRRRQKQTSQMGDGHGVGDQIRITDHASPLAMAVAQVHVPLPAPIDPKRFSVQSSSTTGNSATQIPSYNQAMAYDPLFHPIIPGNEVSQDEKPVHLFREQVDPFIESARTSQFTSVEVPVLEPSRQRHPPPRPQFSPALPAHPQSHNFSPPPVSLTAPEPPHVHLLFPAQSDIYADQTTASSPAISSIRHGSQPGAPPSTISSIRSIFVPQNRESITPSESASNLPYDRWGGAGEEKGG
ncbi:uncharacterized protein PV07_01231 [Cladophialophora immunda]|uniref:Mid2 domain-containing protein n=1 Tax=Cladophialophora immunda TaxID=569365 RepID=A0A0D2CTH6_9EURO|nr:uncharacterized protein PV07_01231 [Cladophialophora immunda]KIW34453.1 hypothetical protein PV07_01231 [Cladophialophora immunda]